MLKIKDNINLKELEKFGFMEYKSEYARKYKNDIETIIDKNTREIRDIDTDYSFKYIKDLGESTRVNDLIKADMVVKIDD